MTFSLKMTLTDGTTEAPVLKFAPIPPGTSDTTPVLRLLKRTDTDPDPITFTALIVDTGGDAEAWVSGTAEHLDSNGAVLETHAVSSTATATVTNMAPTDAVRLTLHASVPSGAVLTTVGDPFALRLVKVN